MIKAVLKEGAILPEQGQDGDAGLDLYTHGETIWISPMKKGLVKTGVFLELEPSTEGVVKGRSGITLNDCPKCLTLDGKTVTADLEVLIGTVDSNYRGEIGIMIRNFSNFVVGIPAGIKLAQLVVEVIDTKKPVIVKQLSNTERSTKGFGSSGV